MNVFRSGNVSTIGVCMRVHPSLELMPMSSSFLWHLWHAGEEHSVVNFTSRCNYGGTHLLMENPHYKAQLARMVISCHCMDGNSLARLHGPREDGVVAAGLASGHTVWLPL